MALPAGLTVLSRAGFDARAAGAAAIGYEGGDLPAFWGYDGVRTLALRTMARLPHAHTPAVTPTHTHRAHAHALCQRSTRLLRAKPASV